MFRTPMLGVALGLLLIAAPYLGRLVHADANPATVAPSGAKAADALPLPLRSASLPREHDASFMRFIDVPDREFSAWTIEAPRYGLMEMLEVRGRTTPSASELSSNRRNDP